MEEETNRMPNKEPGQAPKKKKWDKKKLAKHAGQVLMVLALAFIVYKIAQYEIDFTLLAAPLVIICLVLLAVVWGISVFAASINYSWLLNKLTGKPALRSLVVGIYTKSNLYKYLPGNVMHFVGRNQIAIDVDELTHPEVAFVTITENIFLILSAVIISLVSVFDYFITYFSQVTIPGYVYAIIAAVVVVVVAVLVVFRKKLGGWAKKYLEILKQLRPLTILRLLVFCIVRLLVLALTYLATLALFGQEITLALVPQLLGLYVLSWLIGYIMPGAPGGLGVREAVMLMFLGDVLNQTIMLTATIVHRVICIIGDVVAFLIGLLYTRLKKTPEKGESE